MFLIVCEWLTVLSALALFVAAVLMALAGMSPGHLLIGYGG